MKEKTAMVLHAVLGSFVGVGSAFIQDRIIIVSVMVAVLLVFGHFMQKLFKGKDFKWWFSNGGIVYIFMWLIFWIITYNAVFA